MTLRHLVSTIVAAVLSLLLVPFLAYAWYGFMVIFSLLVVEDRWDQASWWKPVGYYGVGALFVAVGILLLVADGCLGFLLRRVFLGEVGRGRSDEKITREVRRAW